MASEIHAWQPAGATRVGTGGALRYLWAFLALAPVLATTLWVSITALRPWHAELVDFGVYRQAGELALTHRSMYATQGYLPFIYPPFAGVWSMLLALPSPGKAQLVFLTVSAAALLYVCRRMGLSWWGASLAASAATLLASPVRETMHLGQVNLILLALVIMDGIRPRERRWIPIGVMIGIAAALKLTPAIFVVFLLLTRRVRAAVVAMLSFVVATLIGFLVFPSDSVRYWSSLRGGSQGFLFFLPNQSVSGQWARWWSIPSQSPARGALLLSVLIIAVVLAAAWSWWRLGHERYAWVLLGTLSLYGSPIAWNHHFVWIVPLVIVVLADAALPRVERVWALSLALWSAAAPYTVLPAGGGVEMNYSPYQNLVASSGFILAMAWLLSSLATAGTLARRRSRPVAGVDPAPARAVSPHED